MSYTYTQIFLLVVGLLAILSGSSLFLRGATRISSRCHLRPFTTGVFLLALGGSIPELVINLSLTHANLGTMAFATVIGSNMANMLLIIGLSALIFPLMLAPKEGSMSVPILLVGVVMVLMLGADMRWGTGVANTISWNDGVVLLALFALYVYLMTGMIRWLFPKARKGDTGNTQSDESTSKTPARLGGVILSLLTGVALVGVGSWLIQLKLTEILQESYSISQQSIGLLFLGVVVALPELLFAILTFRSGLREMLLGNIAGSSITNITLVLGLSSLFAGALPVYADAVYDLTMLLVGTAALMLTVELGRKRQVSRVEGGFLFLLYVAFIIFVILRASGYVRVPF